MAYSNRTMRLISGGLILLCVGVYIVIERQHTPILTPSMVDAAADYGRDRNLTAPPRPFHFDGCTLFPDRIGRSDFTAACLTHDIAYWYGGTADERQHADRVFRHQIKDSGPAGAILQWPMYVMVRIFGNSLILRPLNANWGFGYND